MAHVQHAAGGAGVDHGGAVQQREAAFRQRSLQQKVVAARGTADVRARWKTDSQGSGLLQPCQGWHCVLTW